jgi:hypothetical protein
MADCCQYPAWVGCIGTLRSMLAWMMMLPIALPPTGPVCAADAGKACEVPRG